MTDREKKLGLAVLAIVALWGAWQLWGQYSEALAQRKKDLQSAEVAYQSAKFDSLKALDDVNRLGEYRERSLPSDPQAAQLEYRAWLFDQLEEAGLAFDDVTLIDRRPGGDAYTDLVYSATAEGDLGAVTRFLHAFYQAPMMHKLTTLKLTPGERGRLQVNLGVRALAVAGAEREDGLPAGESGRLLLADADAYVASIVQRDVFREYVPPRPPPPPRKPRPVVKRDPPPPRPKFDDAAHAYLTGIVQSGDRLQAWINVRTLGETLRVFEGDPLSVGLLKGTVESISARRIVVVTPAGRFATSLGSNLRDGVEIEGPEVDSDDAIF
ncbi:MAG: hypothetical protein AAF589_01545 [Planctomycetota bacterium]